MKKGRGYILKFTDYLELTGDVFDKNVVEEKASWAGKKEQSYAKPWDKDEYTMKQRYIIQEKRKAKGY
jgi:hypothetical protein